MPAKDRYHDLVARALAKDGWVVTAEQVPLLLQGRRLWIDLQAEKEADRRVLLIEVKGFEKMPSPVDYLADVIGQYVLYQAVLDYNNIVTPLFLAVPAAAFDGILGEEIGRQALRGARISLVVFDPDREEIVQWHP